MLQLDGVFRNWVEFEKVQWLTKGMSDLALLRTYIKILFQRIRGETKDSYSDIHVEAETQVSW